VTEQPPNRASVDGAFARYRETGDRRLRDQLVMDHEWIAAYVARRFLDRGEPLDDLVQVARLGLVKAVERFDPAQGTPFPGFAIPTVLGEVRRHFRDATWAVRVPRRAKERSLEVTKMSAALGQELGRAPTVAELADRMQTSEDAVIEALEAASAYRTTSLSITWGDGEEPLEDGPSLRDDDDRVVGAADRVALQAALAALPVRERKIVYLRFFEGLTQSEIAEQVGTSQVHVSRLLRASLSRLHDLLGTDDAALTGGTVP
jgi:RNA polymerase sigma-B factor